MTKAGANEPDNGKVYSAFVEAELKAERDRRALLDTRAAALLTHSGTWIAIVTAAIAVVKGFSRGPISPGAVPWAVAGFFALAIAAFLGLLTGVSRRYAIAELPSLESMLEYWEDDEATARHNVAKANVTTIKSLREGYLPKGKLAIFGKDFSWVSGNNFRAKLISTGHGAQLVGFACVAWAAFLLLR